MRQRSKRETVAIFCKIDEAIEACVKAYQAESRLMWIERFGSPEAFLHTLMTDPVVWFCWAGAMFFICCAIAAKGNPRAEVEILDGRAETTARMDPAKTHQLMLRQQVVYCAVAGVMAALPLVLGY